MIRVGVVVEVLGVNTMDPGRGSKSDWNDSIPLKQVSSGFRRRDYDAKDLQT